MIGATNDGEEPPESGETHMVLFDLKALTQFGWSSPEAVILADTGAAQIVMVSMRNGQALRDVETSSQLIVQCLRGRTTLTIDGQEQALRAGLVALVEADTRHSFVATTDAVLLLTLTPSPERRPAHQLFANVQPLVVRTPSPDEE